MTLGFAVNPGIPTINGVATATLATGLLDFSLLTELFFSHPLTAGYSNNSGSFAVRNSNSRSRGVTDTAQQVAGSRASTSGARKAP